MGKDSVLFAQEVDGALSVTPNSRGLEAEEERDSPELQDAFEERSDFENVGVQLRIAQEMAITVNNLRNKLATKAGIGRGIGDMQ